MTNVIQHIVTVDIAIGKINEKVKVQIKVGIYVAPK
jgi:hypothetical protein